ncbi:ferredoxin reductase-like protein [Coccomyxa subellipsoidea C-169]|uniref:NADH-cytochrome b5 reductase n=1 Tax=Coccomyxa subellipsoidea (strain C-169) TaxID=574566 RepID=I0YXX2_COCSC|nr:ferredoxin reductase-like protein [Coccomyxa subellipsoidea C-169]EIE23241.1 ferredoxin reductase-like protein [Coccomyxa subellipsoidea C-169]|eukprot:XP_005647785.1 ferredoxin reductase-like protein [Coccomyxa subellipsoidea C-169]
MTEVIKHLFTAENTKLVVLSILALVLVPLLSWILVFRGKKRQPFLNPDVWQELPLAEKEVITHNTRRFRFALPYKDQPIGLPIGQHISLKALKPAADGTEIFKPYTPVSDDDLLGYVDFVIKVYEQGRMTKHMDELAIGDKLLFKGPKGRFKYSCNAKRSLGMIAGGTGITPMYQVATQLLKDHQDHTKMSLIFGNVSHDDILIKEELEALAAAHPTRFKVYHVLNQAPPGWTQGVGFITADIIKQHIDPPAEDVMVLRCGPGPMNVAVKKALDGLGYTREMQFEF